MTSVRLVDVAAEHLYFGAWRLRSTLPRRASVCVIEAGYNQPLLRPQSINIGIILTVLEHLPNPLAVMTNILNSLMRPGIMLMDYCSPPTVPLTAKGLFGSPNLGSASFQEKNVFLLLSAENCVYHPLYPRNDTAIRLGGRLPGLAECGERSGKGCGCRPMYLLCT